MKEGSRGGGGGSSGGQTLFAEAGGGLPCPSKYSTLMHSDPLIKSTSEEEFPTRDSNGSAASPGYSSDHSASTTDTQNSSADNSPFHMSPWNHQPATSSASSGGYLPGAGGYQHHHRPLPLGHWPRRLPRPRGRPHLLRCCHRRPPVYRTLQQEHPSVEEPKGVLGFQVDERPREGHSHIHRPPHLHRPPRWKDPGLEGLPQESTRSQARRNVPSLQGPAEELHQPKQLRRGPAAPPPVRCLDPAHRRRVLSLLERGPELAVLGVVGPDAEGVARGGLAVRRVRERPRRRRQRGGGRVQRAGFHWLGGRHGKGVEEGGVAQADREEGREEASRSEARAGGDPGAAGHGSDGAGNQRGNGVDVRGIVRRRGQLVGPGRCGWVRGGVGGSGGCGGVLRGHKVAVLCLVAAGSLLFSGSADKTICVSRRDGVPAHVCLSMLTGHSGPVKCLAVVADLDDYGGGRWVIYSGSLDKSVKVWKVAESAASASGNPQPPALRWDSEGASAYDDHGAPRYDLY